MQNISPKKFKTLKILIMVYLILLEVPLLVLSKIEFVNKLFICLVAWKLWNRWLYCKRHHMNDFTDGLKVGLRMFLCL